MNILFSASLIVAVVSSTLLCADDRPVFDLGLYEKRVHSQNGEDGVIEKIIDIIGANSKYYVEFGAADAHWISNTKYLRESFGWNGLLMDSEYENSKINLHKEFITADNINQLFQKYQVPYDFDVLSIDIDGNDFWVWQALDQSYRPRVIVIEYNAAHGPDSDKTIVYNPLHRWDGTNYFGASMLALQRLGQQKGYTLVYVERSRTNCFFVLDEILDTLNCQFINAGKVLEICKTRPGWSHRRDPLLRPWVSSGFEQNSSG